MRISVEGIIEEWNREDPRLDLTPVRIFGRISRINQAVESALMRILGRHGLTVELFDVLATLRRAGTPFRRSPSELAASAMLTTGGMTRRLTKLQRMDLIERVADSSDGRLLWAQLTPRGVEVINEVIEAHLRQEAAMLAQIDVASRDRLEADLSLLGGVLQDESPLRQASDG